MEFIHIQHTEHKQFITIRAYQFIQQASFVIPDPHTDPKIIEELPTDSIIRKKENIYKLTEEIKTGTIIQILRLTSEKDTSTEEMEAEYRFFEQLGYHIIKIPGISNINRLTGLHGLPLTLRNRNESIWIHDNRFSSPYQNAGSVLEQIAQSPATMVFLHPTASILSWLDIICLYRSENSPVLLHTFSNKSLTVRLDNVHQLLHPANIYSYHLLVIYA